MHTVLIADDEEIERQMLKMQLENNIPEIEVIADVKNGIELLEQASILEPDIMIVDIGMPGINGIDAIKMLRDKGCHSKIIIYSAHSQFEYAQDAIKAHADDYILKPAKKERFCEAVKKCIREIDSMGGISEKNKQMQSLIERMSSTIRSEFIASLMLGDSDIKRMKLYAQALNLSYTSGFMMVFEILDSRDNLPQKELREFYKNKNAAARVINETLGKICGGFSEIYSEYMVVCFIPTSVEKSKYSVKKTSVELAELLVKTVFEKFNLTIFAGIGGVYDSMVKMGISYKESLDVLHNYNVISSVKHFYDFHESAAIKNPFGSYENEFVHFIQNGQMEECSSCLQNIFDLFQDTQDIVGVRDNVYEIVVAVGRRLEENAGLKLDKEFSANYVFAHGEKLNTLENIQDWTNQKFISFHNMMILPASKKHTTIVQNAMKFIEDNLNEDISLALVAENVGVTSYYLCRIFKSELGETFINYITKLRINKAKQLLSKYNYSIRIVCEKIGYQNPTYFCKVFKKTTGQTVNEFKMSLFGKPT